MPPCSFCPATVSARHLHVPCGDLQSSACEKAALGSAFAPLVAGPFQCFTTAALQRVLSTLSYAQLSICIGRIAAFHPRKLSVLKCGTTSYAHGTQECLLLRMLTSTS